MLSLRELGLELSGGPVAQPRLVVVPVHGDRDLPVGTLRSILRQADLTAEELTELAHQRWWSTA